MQFKTIIEHKFFRPALGAALAVLCGLALWQMPLGEAWANASYDYLFRFGARPMTNKVVLILMDNEAHEHFNQVRGQPWSRALHATLLNRLADAGCPLVVVDVFFQIPGDSDTDKALAEAMRRQRQLVLMAKQSGVEHPELASAAPALPTDLFLSAVNTNWGVAWLDPDLDSIVRRHWPFPSPGPYPSLPWAAARLAGAVPGEAPQKRWLRYHGMAAAWTSLSYHLALTRATNYFSDKIVFIGNEPETSVPDGETDEFRTPYTRWTGESAGGVKILATAFLNLVNGDWLRRPPWWLEALVLMATGTLLGGVLCRVRLQAACALAAGASLAVMLGGVTLSYSSNYWFPWLVIVGGQVPCAMVWALVAPKLRRQAEEPAEAILPPGIPYTPDYELFDPPFGEGGYGKVWLARNAIGQWQALKAVYQAKFRENAEPYDREFRGIKRYKPVSDKHPGLLRVDFVSRKKREGYFYYVMELGDAQSPDWEKNPATYKPRDLDRMCRKDDDERQRLPVPECVRIGLSLAEALDFLHRQGLTHRDIKPSNIIFVNGQPKLADVGLTAEIPPPGKDYSQVGTLSYMPAPPEPHGTPQADIYSLGMVLYVISTGQKPGPGAVCDMPTSLAGKPEFMRLNAVILKACQPDCAQRYASAAEMHAALLKVQKTLEAGAQTQRL